jgi:inorganic pyrophosphatase/exopolyphosphatase
MPVEDYDVGDVIHCFNQKIGKNKFHICVCVSKDYFIVINTEDRHFFECVKLEAKDYKFLNGVDRFVECAKIFHQDVRTIMSGQKKGKILEKDLKNIVEKILKSARIPECQKKIVVPELQKIINKKS